MYVKKTTLYRGGQYKRIKKYHTARISRPIPKGEKRMKKEKPTTEQQAAINERRRTENLMGLILENFEEGDMYLTFTYAEKPTGEEQIKDDVRKLQRKLRKLYKRSQEQDLKYIGVIEKLRGGGRAHYHLLIPAMGKGALAEIRKCWSHGKVKSELYGGELEDAERLSAYFCKESKWKTCGKIQCSKHLKRPVEKKEIVKRAKTYSTKLEAPAGYSLVKGMSYTGTTFEGYSFVQVFCRKEEEKKDGKKKQAASSRKSLAAE